MVILNNFINLIEETLKNDSSDSFTLPNSKDTFLKIEYEEYKCSSRNDTGKEYILPFAQSEPCSVSIKSWRRLSALDSNCKDIYELTFDLSAENFKFNPGDTIGILPRNSDKEVNTVIDCLGLDDLKFSQYCLHVKPGHKGKIPSHIPVTSSIHYTLTYCVDLRGVLKKLFLLALSRYTNNKLERNILEYLCSKEGASMYTSHVLNKNISLLDILVMFKSCKPPIEVLFEYLPRLTPRPYSIVNSEKMNPNVVKICFSVMDIGNNRRGLTTGWLETLILNESLDVKLLNLKLDDALNSSKISIYLRKNLNNFTMPEQHDTPIILIGPGTGVAPFIGFLEEREFTRDNSNNTLGPAMLFTGCRDPRLDFIYEKELKAFLDRGILTDLVTAFSRVESCNIKYVQDAILEKGSRVIELIKGGAYVYVCGDVKAIAGTVKEALIRCFIKYDEITEKDAETYISDMLNKKRLLMDVWN